MKDEGGVNSLLFVYLEVRLQTSSLDTLYTLYIICKLSLFD